MTDVANIIGGTIGSLLGVILITGTISIVIIGAIILARRKGITCVVISLFISCISLHAYMYMLRGLYLINSNVIVGFLWTMKNLTTSSVAA